MAINELNTLVSETEARIIHDRSALPKPSPNLSHLRDLAGRNALGDPKRPTNTLAATASGQHCRGDVEKQWDCVI